MMTNIPLHREKKNMQGSTVMPDTQLLLSPILARCYLILIHRFREV